VADTSSSSEHQIKISVDRKELSDSLKGIASQLDELLGKLKELSGVDTGKLTKQTDSLKSSVEGLAQAFSSAGIKATVSMREAGGELKRVSVNLAELAQKADAIDLINTHMGDFAKNVSVSSRVTTGATVELDKLADSLSRVTTEFDKAGVEASISMRQADGELKKVNISLKDLSQASEASKILGKYMGDFADKVSLSARATTGAKESLDGMNVSLDGVIKAFNEMGIQASISMRDVEGSLKSANIRLENFKDKAAATDILSKNLGDFASKVSISTKAITGQEEEISGLSAAFSALTGNVAGVATSIVTELASAGNVFDTLKNKAREFADSLEEALKRVGVAAAAIVGSITAISVGIFKLSKSVGAIQATETAFTRFFNAALKTNEELQNVASSADKYAQSLQDATMGTLSLYDAQLTANKAFAMVGAQIGDKLPQLYRVATAAATTMGKSVEETLYSLVRTVGTLYTRSATLKGIAIDLETAYAHYREEMGLTRKELSRGEKQMAVLNEILRVGKRDIEALGDANLLLSFQTAKAKSSLIDLKNSILSQLAPALSVLMEDFNNLLSRALPNVEKFVTGFLNAFYQIDDGLSDASTQMGHQAGEWAKNAIEWGANIGANFAAGILRGFSAAFSFVVNAIANLIAHFFAPGSPPLVAPDIDQWGMEAIAMWYSAMDDYDPTFKNLLDNLQKQLSDKPKRRLMQWGVDAIAEWAKGLSIFDLELLEMQFKQEIDDVSKVLDELNDKLSTQQSQLFEMQVLGKDPAAIRQKLAEVKATQESVRQRESELARLEERRDEIREQLDLFRKLNQIINQMNQALTGGAGGGGAGGALEGLGEEFPDFDFSGIDAGVGNIKEKMSGFKEWLKEAFNEPLRTVEEAWNNAVANISGAWANLKSVLEEIGLFKWLDENSGTIANLLGHFAGVALAGLLFAGALKILFSKAVLTTLALIGLFNILKKLAVNAFPELSEVLTPGQQALLGLGLAAEWSRDLIATLGIAFADCIGLFLDGFALVAQVFGTLNYVVNPALDDVTDSLMGFADEQREIADRGRENARKWAEDFRLDISDMADAAEDVVKKNSWDRLHEKMSESIQVDTGVASKHFEDVQASVQETFGTNIPGILEGDYKQALEQTGIDTETFSADAQMQFSDMSNEIGENIVPEMTRNIESVMQTSYTDLQGDTEAWAGNIETEYQTLSDDLVGTKDSIIPFMMQTMQDTMAEYGNNIVLDTREWGAHVYGVIDGVQDATEALLKSLKRLKEWCDNNTIHVRIQTDNIPQELVPGSLPPLAQGIKDINEQLMHTRRSGGLRPFSDNIPKAYSGGAQASTVNINEPLMQNVTFVVPNMTVGRKVAEDLSREMGDIILARRQPG